MIVDSLSLLDTLNVVTDSVVNPCVESLPILDNTHPHPIQDDVLTFFGLGDLLIALFIFIMGLVADGLVRNVIKRRSEIEDI